MNDVTISMTCVLSTVLWLGGFGLAVANLAGYPDSIGNVGLIMCLGGGTLTIRAFFCRQWGREEKAFALGRDYEAGRVRSLH